VPTGSQACGNPSPDQPRVPYQKHRTSHDRAPYPAPSPVTAGDPARTRQAKRSNAASSKAERAVNNRRQAPPPAPWLVPADGQVIALYDPGRTRRRRGEKPPGAANSQAAARPALPAVFLDFFERRAAATDSVDEEIRLLRAYVLAALALVTVPLGVVVLVVLAIARAVDADALSVMLPAALGAGSLTGATVCLLRWWTASRAASSQHRSRRPRRRR
jgi:uncharacterized membrane protein YqjE